MFTKNRVSILDSIELPNCPNCSSRVSFLRLLLQPRIVGWKCKSCRTRIRFDPKRRFPIMVVTMVFIFTTIFCLALYKFIINNTLAWWCFLPFLLPIFVAPLFEVVVKEENEQVRGIVNESPLNRTKCYLAGRHMVLPIRLQSGFYVVRFVSVMTEPACLFK